MIDAVFAVGEGERVHFSEPGKGLEIAVPRNYFPDDDPRREPIVRWRGHASLLYANWLNYYVYQQTPYDVDAISNGGADWA